jgi:hypothetical protein
MSLSGVHISYPESRKHYGQTGTVKLAGVKGRAGVVVVRVQSRWILFG